MSSSLSLNLDYLHVHDNQSGVVATGLGQVSVVNSVFEHNGSVTGGASIDVGTVGTLTISGTTIHDPSGGSGVKSSAQQTTIDNSTIGDFTGTSAHALELPKGGIVSIQSTVLERGPNATTSSIIAYGAALNLYAGSQVTINNSSFNRERPLSECGVVVRCAFGLSQLDTEPNMELADDRRRCIGDNVAGGFKSAAWNRYLWCLRLYSSFDRPGHWLNRWRRDTYRHRNGLES